MKIFDARGTEGLALQYVGVTVAWASILAGELRFDSVVLERPELVIRRDARGTLFIAGIEMKPDEPSDGVGLTDWPLKQGEIVVRDATVEWQDDLRRAVPLKLESVDFLLQNDGRHHRFALRAQPPRELGSPLELRGDLTGRNLAELESWNGKLYAAFDHVDLAVWQAWVDYPFEVRSGRGALRLWLGFADRTLTELTVSVGLDDVAGRFAADLPLLEVRSMRGQFGMKKTTEFELIDLDGQRDIEYQAFARQLTLVAKDGVAFAPADFTAKWRPAQGKDPARGEFLARSIELGPLAHVGEYVPLPAEARKALVTVGADRPGERRDLRLDRRDRAPCDVHRPRQVRGPRHEGVWRSAGFRAGHRRVRRQRQGRHGDAPVERDDHRIREVPRRRHGRVRYARGAGELEPSRRARSWRSSTTSRSRTPTSRARSPAPTGTARGASAGSI